MRVYRKWNIVPIVLIVALISAWLAYTHTNEFKARKLIAELRYCKGSFQSPTGKDRWLFTAALATPRTRDFREVSDELVAMGESAVPFLLEEVQKLGKGNTNSYSCAYLLAKIGTPAVRPLLEILEGLPQENTPNRMLIIRALAAVDPPATEAVPALLRDLKSDNGIVRNFAAIALARIDPDVAARKALPIVLKDLEHPDPGLHFFATWALSEIGPRTKEAKTAIDKARRGKFKPLFDQSPRHLF